MRLAVRASVASLRTPAVRIWLEQRERRTSSRESSSCATWEIPWFDTVGQHQQPQPIMGRTPTPWAPRGPAGDAAVGVRRLAQPQMTP